MLYEINTCLRRPKCIILIYFCSKKSLCPCDYKLQASLLMFFLNAKSGLKATNSFKKIQRALRMRHVLSLYI